MPSHPNPELSWLPPEPIRYVEVPERCERPGCGALVESYCPLCQRCYCEPHDRLPGGHACLSPREPEDLDPL